MSNYAQTFMQNYIYMVIGCLEPNDDLLIGIIIAAMTVQAIIIIVLHINDPVYPAKSLRFPKNIVLKPILSLLDN